MSLTAWVVWLISVVLMFGALFWFAERVARREERRAERRRSFIAKSHEDAIATPDGRWRVGRHLGRTVYLQIGDQPSDQDLLLGMMDTAEVAHTVIEAVNEKRRREGPWIS